MIVLFSHPEKIYKEAEVTNLLMEQYPALLFHLRKPETDLRDFESFLKAIRSGFHSRIVIHQHHLLAAEYDLKGIHFREEDRDKSLSAQKVVSTSFHTLEEARRSGQSFDYFFCSPVFPSISKLHYKSDENWDISALEKEFSEKAVALGGVEKSRKEELDLLGFKNAAVLGAVWYAADPIAAFSQIAEAFDV